MANSPLQIVLNSKDFIEIWDRPKGGGKKDFYEHKDNEFIEHRAAIVEQLESLKREHNLDRFGPITFAKVTLKQAALAKSHRPTSSLFKEDVAKIVGAGELGQLYIEISRSNIDVVKKKALLAEDHSKWIEDKNGKMVCRPSVVRSEVGAIEKIEKYTSFDKRSFSVAEAVEWLSDARTGGNYLIELFDLPTKDWQGDIPDEKGRLFGSFFSGLSQLKLGMIVVKAEQFPTTHILSIRIEQSSGSAVFALEEQEAEGVRLSPFEQVDLIPEHHGALLDFLDSHPLVKRVILPPIISKSSLAQSKPVNKEDAGIPKMVKGRIYPKVGIIDGGVSDVLGEWIEKRYGFLSKTDMLVDHGTFIGGLLVRGMGLNGADICPELDGCQIIDIDIMPKDSSFDSYYPKSIYFFDELAAAVRNLKEETGVRIFNFSLNIEEHSSADGYSYSAQVLDRIAVENDVIFVISAGNSSKHRKEWPQNPVDALKILATRRDDTIKNPSESFRNLSVAALNPPNMEGVIAYAPSIYTCRGPKTSIGMKPDLAHVGGCGTKTPDLGHGLNSIDANGFVVDGCGTSYAVPHISKLLACLDANIEGYTSREGLMAMAIHHAAIPEILKDKNFREIAKHFVGFGMPSSSDVILNGDPSAITLVFSNKMVPGKRLTFNFSWPPSLVSDGKCHGYARLTVVSAPPFDYNFGTELVRVNIEASLRQQQKTGNYLGRLVPMHVPEDLSDKLFERDLIEHAFKWSPIKASEKTFSGVGPTANWRLDIEYLCRAGESMPLDGVPFTAILTLSDPSRKAPVFNEMRRILQLQGVNLVDIRTAARVRPRS